MLIVEII